GELDGLPVRPHPGRPAVEGVQRLEGGGGGAGKTLDVPIDALAIRPVALDGDEAKALLADEPPADPRSPRIELVRAVRRLAQQDVVRVADPVDQRIEVAIGRERPGD